MSRKITFAAVVVGLALTPAASSFANDAAPPNPSSATSSPAGSPTAPPQETVTAPPGEVTQTRPESSAPVSVLPSQAPTSAPAPEVGPPAQPAPPAEPPAQSPVPAPVPTDGTVTLPPGGGVEEPLPNCAPTGISVSGTPKVGDSSLTLSATFAAGTELPKMAGCYLTITGPSGVVAQPRLTAPTFAAGEPITVDPALVAGTYTITVRGSDVTGTFTVGAVTPPPVEQAEGRIFFKVKYPNEDKMKWQDRVDVIPICTSTGEDWYQDDLVKGPKPLVDEVLTWNHITREMMAQSPWKDVWNWKSVGLVKPPKCANPTTPPVVTPPTPPKVELDLDGLCRRGSSVHLGDAKVAITNPSDKDVVVAGKVVLTGGNKPLEVSRELTLKAGQTTTVSAEDVFGGKVVAIPGLGNNGTLTATVTLTVNGKVVGTKTVTIDVKGCKDTDPVTPPVTPPVTTPPTTPPSTDPTTPPPPVDTRKVATPVKPVVSDTCRPDGEGQISEDFWTVPTVEGVEYRYGQLEALKPGTKVYTFGKKEVKVTATPASGYKFDGDQSVIYALMFTDDKCQGEPGPIPTPKPTEPTPKPTTPAPTPTANPSTPAPQPTTIPSVPATPAPRDLPRRPAPAPQAPVNEEGVIIPGSGAPDTGYHGEEGMPIWALGMGVLGAAGGIAAGRRIMVSRTKR